jgi:hypothetical protein
MKRDRLRTEVENMLLDLLLRAAAGKVDGRSLSATAFAIQAGLSRQALYKTHGDIAQALVFLSKARTPDAKVEVLRRQLKEAKQEKDDADKKLKGSVKQNLQLVAEIYELRSRLKARGLALVSSQPE